MDIRFDGKVAIVTGAGNGLGRSHALELARRGAKVVVNDLGAARDGAGASSEAARAVAAEIAAAGGQAIVNGASVTDSAGVDGLIRQTMDAWGRIDIVVANAGILRDKTFSKMPVEDFQLVLNVHLMGAVNVIKGAWDIMRDQNYGRIVVTTSQTGLYGNFGQANYGAAKAGLVGLMHTLKIEGQKNNIRVNTICPVAATRMTEDIGIPEATLAQLKPELATAGVVCLAGENAPNGAILVAGAGSFALARMQEAEGAFLGPNATAEDVAAAWATIADFSNAQSYFVGNEQSVKIMGRLQR